MLEDNTRLQCKSIKDENEKMQKNAGRLSWFTVSKRFSVPERNIEITGQQHQLSHY
jgi:hypothetical protein